MERRAFLQNIGSTAALALTVGCLGACNSTSPTFPSGPVDFSLDLSLPANSGLLVAGAFVISNDCVVAHGFDGKYYAATVICTHEGRKAVVYDKQNNDYYCPTHGSRFRLDGSVQVNPATAALTIYITELSGNTLRVHS